ncbi:MAG: prepilin-type N-terminal cleavage/methylation domain-containing protein [Dokdonella sp.]|uniref:type IV pilus modification PilV family protein n=1 Tax=Dokdonella sp. TaxID=2291710 RepID=UPI0025BC79F9|nr:prepilin-type N-terminal cleavage/methylation domain-containing protein [Dokdonella sp.]MBX3701147.1 prepilin-type N-terminal cleavage/methylation domain-containing protein [Dokdonella sp.]
MKQSSPAFARRRSMRGFSLIEMVAAFLVFAIAIGVLMSVLTAAMRNTRMSADYTMAALWAQSRLDIVGVGIPVEEGHTSGRFDDTYNWDLDIHKIDAAAVEPPPQLVAANAQQLAQAQNQSRNAAAQAMANGMGGPQDAPFDLYEVDLVVSWGGRHGGTPRSAHFSTLRAVNPEQAANGMPGVGLNMADPMRRRPR